MGGLSGSLLKRGAGNTAWQRRWFVLAGDQLRWFEDEKATVARRTVRVVQVSSEVVQVINQRYEFDLVGVDTGSVSSMKIMMRRRQSNAATEGGDRYRLAAESLEQALDWIGALHKAIGLDWSRPAGGGASGASGPPARAQTCAMTSWEIAAQVTAKVAAEEAAAKKAAERVAEVAAAARAAAIKATVVRPPADAGEEGEEGEGGDSSSEDEVYEDDDEEIVAARARRASGAAGGDAAGGGEGGGGEGGGEGGRGSVGGEGGGSGGAGGARGSGGSGGGNGGAG